MSSPLRSGNDTVESWQERVWQKLSEALLPDVNALSELDRALLMKGSVVVSLTAARSGSDEHRERG